MPKHADDCRREHQCDAVAHCERQREPRAPPISGGSGGATIINATYAPSAKNDPCARLIVSIKPDDQHEAEREQREQQPERDAVDQMRCERGQHRA